MTEHYDLAVLGAGQGGPALAAARARAGDRVVLVERRALGGTCVNDGCTPTKTLRKSARVAHLARSAGGFGVTTGPIAVDFMAAMDRVRTIVDASRERLGSGLGATDNLTILRGHGQIAGREQGTIRIDVGSHQISASRVVINTGTRPFVPPITGLGSVDYLDNTSILELDTLPHHLIVLGASYIGLEMGQIFRRLGSQVSIIERGPAAASREDADISAAIAAMFAAEDIPIHVDTAVDNVSRAGDGSVVVTLGGGETITGSHLLVAVGRVPNTDAIGLDTIGVERTDRGHIIVNDRLETTADNVWALGDVNGRGAFTHTSYHDHQILLENWAGANRSVDDRTMVYAMFTDPPLGHVGLYQADALRLVQDGANISQAVIPMRHVSRAIEESETIGLMKLLLNEDSGLFIGASMLGIGADEVIQVIAHIMANGGTWKTARETLPVHPTVTEFLPTLIDRREPLAATLA